MMIICNRSERSLSGDPSWSLLWSGLQAQLFQQIIGRFILSAFTAAVELTRGVCLKTRPILHPCSVCVFDCLSTWEQSSRCCILGDESAEVQVLLLGSVSEAAFCSAEMLLSFGPFPDV